MDFAWVCDHAPRKYRERNVGTQNIIRRHATQVAALTKKAKRQQAAHASCEIQELQLWVVDDPSAQSSTSSEWTHVAANTRLSAREMQANLSCAPMPTCPVRTPYLSLSASRVPHLLPELLQRQDFQSDVLKALMAHYALQDDHVRYFKILALIDAGCLPMLSSHYGQSTCLDAAIDCTAARVQDFLNGQPARASTVRLYTRALQELSGSIETAAYGQRFEIYRSIPLLMLFELLNPSDQVAYMNHATGVVNLLYLIGPEGMKTELDKNLLAVQSAMMVTERLRDGHVHFCAAPEWQGALQQTIRKDLQPGVNRSEANVTLTMIAAALPGLFNRVEKAVISPDASTGPSLPEGIEETHAKLREWRRRWEAILRTEADDDLSNARKKFQLAVFFIYTAIFYRLVSAAPSSLEERMKAEHRAEKAAKDALEIAAMADHHGFIWQIRPVAVTKLARSIADTSDDWQQVMKQATPMRPVSAALFRAWCDRAGRERGTPK